MAQPGASAGGGLSVAIERRVLRHAVLVLLLALLLSRPRLALLWSLAAVLAGSWLAGRADVSWRAQRLSLRRRPRQPAFEGAHARPSLVGAGGEEVEPGRVEQRADVSWREALSAPGASAELDALITKIVSEFITELWFKNLSADPQFPAETRRLILTFCGALAPRIRGVNLGALLVRDVCEVLTEQLDVYRRVCSSIGEDTLDRLSPEARDRAFAAELSADGELLPAAASLDGEAAALRRFAEAMLSISLPAAERGAPLLRTIARELLGSCVLRPIVGFAAPFWVNKCLIAALRSPASVEPAAPLAEPQPLDAPQPPPASRASSSRLAGGEEGVGEGAEGAEGPDTDEDDAELSSDGSEEGAGGQRSRRTASMGSLSELGALSDVARAPGGGPVRPLRAGLLTARVTGSSVLGESSFSTHVNYTITVSDGLGANWVVHRRFSNFEALHKRVKVLRARGRHKLPPKRILYHAPEGDFMDERKLLLDQYLQNVMADARLAASPEVWDFLSSSSRSYVAAPGAGGVLKSMSLGLSAGLSSASDAVTASVNTVTSSLDWSGRRALQRAGGPPPPAPVALASASTVSAFATVPEQPPGSPTRAAQPRPASEARVAHEPPEPSGLMEPVLCLVDCVFRLREHGVMRRRILNLAVHAFELLAGGAVEEKLAGALARVRSESTAVTLLRLVLNALWPGGQWFRLKQAAEARAEGRELPPPGTPPGFGGVPIGQEELARTEACLAWTLLQKRVQVAGMERLLGVEAQRRGIRELYGMLQSPLFMRHIGHSIVEAALAAMYPELHGVLLEVRCGGRDNAALRARGRAMAGTAHQA